MMKLTETDSDDISIGIMSQLRDTLAFQMSDSDEFVMLIAGALSHQTIRLVSARLDGIAAYKGLDMLVENPYQASIDMYQVLAKSALT